MQNKNNILIWNLGGMLLPVHKIKQYKSVEKLYGYDFTDTWTTYIRLNKSISNTNLQTHSTLYHD